MHTFSSWLAEMLGESRSDVERILTSETATQFLIAWSLFESKCFSGFLKASAIESFGQRVVDESFSALEVGEQLDHFHKRYKNKKLLQNLLYTSKTADLVVSRFQRCLDTELVSMSANDRVFFVVFVIYRFRNNVFHGNKGVQSWLAYDRQIRLCTRAMQALVSHAEKVRPTLQDRLAA